MAAQARRTPPPVAQDLLERPQAYSFIQVVRLLKLASGQTGGEELRDFLAETLRVRPHLSLGFPGTDVTGIRTEEAGDRTRYRVSASFLGLYGASSPLPTHYTEELLEEAREDHSGLRDFLDIFNNTFFIKLYRAWSRNRLAVRMVEEQDEATLERAFCLIGLGHKSLRDRFTETYRALRYAGLYTQYPRSALGLKTVLADRLGGVPVQVEQCLPQRLPVPEDQRLRLGRSGNTLGEEAVLGSQTVDHMGKFGIKVGPLDAETFQALLPDAGLHASLEEHVRLFQVQPLSYDLTLTVEKDQYDPATLGGARWSKLGQDTWLFAGERDAPGSVTFAKNRPGSGQSRAGGPHRGVPQGYSAGGNA